MAMILHAGCGSGELPRHLRGYKETRLDCDPAVKPDVLASITAMPMLESESFDAVYLSHCLEHLYAHEVGMALSEFSRVLKPGGMLELLVPDLQSIGAKIALDEIDVPLYLSPMGPVSPLDMLYGLRCSVANGSVSMAHKTGFTKSSLTRALERAGFKVEVERTQERGTPELKAIAEKAHASSEREAEAIPECHEGPCLGQAAFVR